MGTWHRDVQKTCLTTTRPKRADRQPANQVLVLANLDPRSGSRSGAGVWPDNLVPVAQSSRSAWPVTVARHRVPRGVVPLALGVAASGALPPLVGTCLLKPTHFRAAHNKIPLPGPRARSDASAKAWPCRGHGKHGRAQCWLVAREALPVPVPMRPLFPEWTVVPLNAWNLPWRNGCWGRAGWRYRRSGSGVWG